MSGRGSACGERDLPHLLPFSANVSGPPGTGSRSVATRQRVQGDVGVLYNLEIVHAHTDEIRTTLKGKLEAVLGFDRARRENLVRNPRLLEAVHKLHDLFRVPAPDIVVVFFLDTGRPVVAAVQRLYPEIRLHAETHTFLDGFQEMGTDAGGQTVLPDVIERLGNLVDLAFCVEFIGDAALDVAGVGSALDGEVDALDDIVAESAVRNELDLAASCAPVLVDHTTELWVREQRVNSALLGKTQRLKDLLV